MNILIFNWRDVKHVWAGGGEIYIFEQAKRWIKSGHSVTLFCGDDFEKKLPAYEVVDGIRIHRRGNRYSLYFWAAWYYITKFRGKFDILIDVVNGIPFFTPLFSRLPKVCFVYHVHGDQFFYEIPFPLNHLGFFIEKYLFPLVYRNVPIIAISQTTKRQLVKNGLQSKNIHIVYCGINGASRNTGRSTKKFSHPVLLYLGRIKKYKRVDMLVRIFPNILERVPTARLVIAGWGTEASLVTDLVMKSPLRRKMSLLGPVTNSEKQTLLSKSWIFVNPSIGEGWSIAVIEANLYGTPAVAFNVTGLAESIRHKKTGMLAADENELVDHIVTILTKKSFRTKLSNDAKQWAFRFSWDRSAKESLRVLERAYRKTK